MSAYAVEMRNQLVGLFGIVERNVYLTKRYFLWDLAFMVWTIANTLTIVFISRGIGVSPAHQNEIATKPSCAPFSGEMSGRTAVIIPTPMNDTDAMARSPTAAA